MANEYTAIARKLQDISQSDKILRIALSTVFAIHKQRIFAEGFDVKGTKIGTYGTNPISISKKNQARQTGKTYFPGGYSEYKTAVGKNPGFVILRNTDQMFGDYGLIGSGTSWGFGFQNTENYNKSQWMEAKYQKSIFDLSGYEQKVLNEVITNAVSKAL